MTQSRSHLIRLFVIQFAVFVGFLVISEGVARLIQLPPMVYRLRAGLEKSAYEYSENPRLGYVLKANYRDENPDYHQSFPYTNAHGRRDIERAYQRVPGKRRILMLGDSVVAGHGIRDLNDTLSRQLERRFPNGESEVSNFGTGGYCTLGEIELLKQEGLRYQPDQVVLVFVENDYEGRNGQVHQYRKSPLPAWFRLFVTQSTLFRHFAYRLNIYSVAMVERNVEALGEDNVSEGLRMFRDLAQKNGFDPQIVVWPSFSEKANYHEPRWGRSAEHLRVETIAKGLGLKTARLDSYFEQDQAQRCSRSKSGIFERDNGHCKDSKSLYTIGDGMHPSELGAEVGAKAIYDLLQNDAKLVTAQARRIS